MEKWERIKDNYNAYYVEHKLLYYFVSFGNDLPLDELDALIVVMIEE